MPFWRLYYHLVWSTKNREPLIDENYGPGYLLSALTDT